MDKLLLIVLSLVAAIPCGAWPARVFAPYMYLGGDDNFKLTDCDDACGVKYYTLAFIIARQEGWGKSAVYHGEAAWDGRFPMEEDLYRDQIEAMRKRGGDVIASFGGEAGRELAIIETNDVKLESLYQSIIDRYHFTWLDFDIEGENLDKHWDASRRRNAVLAHLQEKNPGLIISYTLPVNPKGLSGSSLELLADAKGQGVKVHSADIMVMFFGKKFINKGKSEAELGIESAEAAHAQLEKIDLSIAIGLCPCLGRNGSKDEVFTLDDAKTLRAFADKTGWVCSLHFWSINDDAGRPHKRRPALGEPWAFANIFKSFTSQ